MPDAEKDAAVVSLNQRRAKRNESLPAPGEPAITFSMDDDRITFRDQAALDEYVAGAILEHSRYHGGGVDECSSDPASPCARTRDLPPAIGLLRDASDQTEQHNADASAEHGTSDPWFDERTPTRAEVERDEAGWDE